MDEKTYIMMNFDIKSIINLMKTQIKALVLIIR